MSWNYPDEFRDQVTFEIQVSVDGGDLQTLDRKKDMQYIYGSPDEGVTYQFYVTALSDDHSSLRSDPASVTIEIPEAVEDPVDDPDAPDDEDPNDIPDPTDNIGNGDGSNGDGDPSNGNGDSDTDSGDNDTDNGDSPPSSDGDGDNDTNVDDEETTE
ncbi:multimodular transpeptidase-transglycosylase [Halalkalibacter hemicellulosilyticusJCM 9152]|uniref:Multimodular transpeptidase-transglycosylase n=2 Tax=Halalkalibacter TaxID=2893056 RepID=W4QBL2_9BACI|nr:multimodular transpeptidase-transglycosylase [Halalkalibacter hemicellulosilyticusJCM 9152]